MDDAVVAAATVVILSCSQLLLLKNQEKQRRKRRWWMLSLNKSRERYNASDMLQNLRAEPSGKFLNFCRMSAEDFEIILTKIGPKIVKQDTNMRKAIPIQERLAVTLRFLATGDSFVSLEYLFKISHQSISRIVPEVCKAIIDVLKDEIKLPKSQEEWKTVANDFQRDWNFPHCLGAVDGKHILLQAPFNSESQFFNYKKTFSIILMALVNSGYCFMFIDVGAQGRMNDAGVFASTNVYRKIIRNELMLPPFEPLLGRLKKMPYVFIGDDAFPMSSNLLKPYVGNHPKSSLERIFNYRLCRARRVVENVFGIFASVFRVFRSPILLQPDKAALICMTCALLHNFLRRSATSRKLYTPTGTFDHEEDGELIPGTWRNNVQGMTSFNSLVNKPRKPSEEAKDIRREFGEYFMTSGAVEWQNYIQ